MSLGFMQVITRDKDGKKDIQELCEKIGELIGENKAISGGLNGNPASNVENGLIMAEIGCYAGDSTVLFVASNLISEINCIDAWENDYDGDDICSYTCPMRLIEGRFEENVNKFNSIKINKIKKYSTEAAKLFKDETFDWIYIDACHTYEAVKEDLLAWIPKVKNGGFISGHDYDCPIFPGVKKAVIEIVGKPDYLFCSGSWLKIKKTVQ